VYEGTDFVLVSCGFMWFYVVNVLGTPLWCFYVVNVLGTIFVVVLCGKCSREH
jgi:hypothetical protein